MSLLYSNLDWKEIDSEGEYLKGSALEWEEYTTRKESDFCLLYFPESGVIDIGQYVSASWYEGWMTGESVRTEGASHFYPLRGIVRPLPHRNNMPAWSGLNAGE